MLYEKVKEYCDRNDIPISQFEKMCGLGNGTVSGWKGKNNPNLKTMMKIEDSTKIPISKWIR